MLSSVYLTWKFKQTKKTPKWTLTFFLHLLLLFIRALIFSSLFFLNGPFHWWEVCCAWWDLHWNQTPNKSVNLTSSINTNTGNTATSMMACNIIYNNYLNLTGVFYLCTQQQESQLDLFWAFLMGGDPFQELCEAAQMPTVLTRAAGKSDTAWISTR